MIHELLLCGGTNAIPAADIAQQVGMSERCVRRKVEAERLAGAVILSDESGYFKPSEDPAIARWEIQAWIAQRTATAGTILKTAELARKAMPSQDGS